MKIWYTKGLSNTVHALQLLRRDWPAQEYLALMASHTEPRHPVSMVCNHFEVEPKDIEGPAYAQWCLERAIANGVDLIVAQRRPASLWLRKSLFDEAGIRLVLPTDPQTLSLIDEKNRFCDLTLSMGIPTAEYRTFNTVEEFDQAEAELRETTIGRVHGVCVKPITGIYGSGFRILVRDGEAGEIDRILNVDNLEIDQEQFRKNLGKSRMDRTFMMMGYLPGVERSVDFLAQDGRFVGGVARRKEGILQRLESTGDSIEMAKALTERLNLNGVCNLQTKECDGVPHILEVNARMSGGMQMACMSGLNLPLWSARLALGLCNAADVPEAMGAKMVGVSQVCFEV